MTAIVIPFATKTRLVTCDGCGDFMLSNEIGYHVCKSCERAHDEYIAATLATDPEYQAWVAEQDADAAACPF